MTARSLRCGTIRGELVVRGVKTKKQIPHHHPQKARLGSG
jgi:hypothetical protein